MEINIKTKYDIGECFIYKHAGMFPLFNIWYIDAIVAKKNGYGYIIKPFDGRFDSRCVDDGELEEYRKLDCDAAGEAINDANKRLLDAAEAPEGGRCVGDIA